MTLSQVQLIDDCSAVFFREPVQQISPTGSTVFSVFIQQNNLWLAYGWPLIAFPRICSSKTEILRGFADLKQSPLFMAPPSAWHWPPAPFPDAPPSDTWGCYISRSFRRTEIWLTSKVHAQVGSSTWMLSSGMTDPFHRVSPIMRYLEYYKYNDITASLFYRTRFNPW